jgi:DNA-binding transcriptional regulator/RsmH inhibitor MraZ
MKKPLTGTFTVPIDDRGRITFPAYIKNIVFELNNGVGVLYLAVSEEENKIYCHTIPSLDDYKKKIDNETLSTRDSLNRTEDTFSEFEGIPLTKDGRLKVPKKIIESLHFAGDSTLLFRGAYYFLTLTKSET